MREDPVRSLLRRRRNYKAQHQDIVNELNHSDSIFREYDKHVAKDKTIESKHSRNRLKSNIYGNAEGVKLKQFSKKYDKATTTVAAKNKNNSSSQSNRSKSPSLRMKNRGGIAATRNSTGVTLADNAWATENSLTTAPSKKSQLFPFDQLGVDSATLDYESSVDGGRGGVGGTGRNEIFDAGQGWTVSTFAEHSYVTTKIIPPTPAHKQKHHQVSRPSSSHQTRLKPFPGSPHHSHSIPDGGREGGDTFYGNNSDAMVMFHSPLPAERPKSAPNSFGGIRPALHFATSPGCASPTEIKGNFVRKRREELCKMREMTLRAGIEEREQTHNAMALERAQLVSKVLLRGLFAAQAAKTFDFIIQSRNRKVKAVAVIQRSARRYLKISDITIMKSINSDSMIRKRKNVAVDLIKSLLESTSFHNKLMRGIFRVKNSARILQFHAKQWLTVRNSRHFALMKLWKKLEPSAQREAQRIFAIKQARALKPNRANTPEWLVKGAEALSELREKCLKESNLGKALISEAKRAELHRKWMQEHGHKLGTVAGHAAAAAAEKQGKDEEVRLNFLARDRVSDSIISQECHNFLFHERTKIFEKHRKKQILFRANAERARHEDVGTDISDTVAMDFNTMANYLAASPHSIKTALKNAEESRELDKLIAEQRKRNDLLSVPMGKLFIFSGPPRRVFESRVLHVCIAQLQPFDEEID